MNHFIVLVIIIEWENDHLIKCHIPVYKVQLVIIDINLAYLLGSRVTIRLRIVTKEHIMIKL